MSQKNVTTDGEKGPYFSFLYELITVFEVTISCREVKHVGTHICDQGGIGSVIYGIQVFMSH